MGAKRSSARLPVEQSELFVVQHAVHALEPIGIVKQYADATKFQLQLQLEFQLQLKFLELNAQLEQQFLKQSVIVAFQQQFSLE